MITVITSLLTTQEASYMNIDSTETIEFLEALEYSLVRKSSLSVPYWLNKVGVEPLNRILYVLGKHNLVSSTVAKKYASITATEHLYSLIPDITEFRINAKIRAYGMKCNREESPSNLTSTPSGIKDTGLDRPGFVYAVKQEFRLDTAMMKMHRDMIIANATKSIEKTILKYEDITLDEANYRELCTIVIDNYIANPRNSYNMEYNINDQRGRAIYGGLKRIFNPVSSKDARACLVATRPVVVSKDDADQMKDIYLFIAELIGSKANKVNTKMLAGMIAYKKRTLPELHAEELHEYIWLSRIYSALDKVMITGSALWSIPLEMDASMSLAQIEGALLDSQELLIKTNAVKTATLQDPWFVEGTRRLAAKAIGTPTFYGSNQSPMSLLRSKNLEIDKAELAILNKEFNTGVFSILKDYKNLLIGNMEIDNPTYTAIGWDETYTVEVNKHKAVGATLDAYTVWNTETQRDVLFYMHSPIRVPDYDRFRTYAATGLTHNAESKVVDNTMCMLKALAEWAIAIHDAILCLPGSNARKAYSTQLSALNKVGKEVLIGYMQSIGATSAKANIELVKLLDKVTPNKLEFSENALK